MITLLIDTATDFLIYALFKDEEVIDSFVVAAEKKHSDTALYMIQNSLIKKGIKQNEIDRMYIGGGPGSYSGIRIARTIAKMLQLVSTTECYQFSTIAFLQLLTGESQIGLHAGKNQVYAQVEGCDQIIQRDQFQGMVIDSGCGQLPQKISYEVVSQLMLVDLAEQPYYVKGALA